MSTKTKRKPITAEQRAEKIADENQWTVREDIETNKQAEKDFGLDGMVNFWPGTITIANAIRAAERAAYRRGYEAGLKAKRGKR